jgi:hypothetical protein
VSDAPAPPRQKLLDFRKRVPEPVHSIALGIRQRAAALGADPWMIDGERVTKIAFPPPLVVAAGERDEAAIFFGRDNQPRIMGGRISGSSARVLYLRFKGGVWRREPGEIGKLAEDPQAAMFGVLGHDDPEVVCKMGGICIIKRLTGWTMIDAGPGRPEVSVNEKRAWALHRDHVAVLEKDGWHKLGGAVPWRASPTAIWGSQAVIWVSVHEETALYRFASGRWDRHPSPLAGPRGLWGRSASDVWLAADGGAAHFDGERWQVAAGIDGPLAVVSGDASEVWLGGRSGMWQGRKP